MLVEPLECVDATLDAGLITARVGVSFRLVFRLSSEREQRVQVELVSAGAKRRVDSARSSARFSSLTPAMSGAYRIVKRLGDATTKAPAASATPEPVVAPASHPKPPDQPPTSDVARAGAPPDPGAVEAPEAPTPTSPASLPGGEPGDLAWLEEFSEPGVREVMAYIAEHGSITEADLIQLLGRPSRARRFARKFDDYCKQAPFLMDQTHTAAGKVYRKVSNK